MGPTGDLLDHREWFIGRNNEQVLGRPRSPESLPLALCREVIDRFSKPEGIIIDPFCGYGSILVAARQLGRSAIGIDIDPTRAAGCSVLGLDVQVHTGDAAVILPAMTHSVDMCFTSPPFGVSSGELMEAGETYIQWIIDMLAKVPLAPQGILAIEFINIPVTYRQISSLALLYKGLQKSFAFVTDIVCCEETPRSIATLADHTTVSIWRQRDE